MVRHDTPPLYMAAALLLPAGAMFGAHFFGSSPAKAGASPITIEPPQIGAFPVSELPAIEPTPEPMEARAIPSPFWFDELNAVNNRVIEQDPTPAPNPTPRPRTQPADPVFEITSILPSARNPLAVINGKPCKLGDEIQSGWTLQTIDGRERTVTLVHISGRKIIMGLKNTP